jgi:lipoprotein
MNIRTILIKIKIYVKKINFTIIIFISFGGCYEKII